MSLISRLHHVLQGTHENEYDGTIMEFFSNPKINLATINAVIRGVASPYGRKLTLYLPEPVKSQVTEEYRKILESKNWEIS